MSKSISSSDIEGEDIYKGKEEELVLVLLSELYSDFNAISIGISGYSSCHSTLHYLLTTYLTDYYSKKIYILIFLRRESLK